jgi:tetratricopeptide (TPR) repeat protein
MKRSTPPAKKLQPGPRWWLFCSLFLAVLLPLMAGALASWHSMGGLDIWLHHKAGQEILSGNGISAVNGYSFSEPDHPWTNHEWLFQILIGATGPDPSNLEEGIHRWNVLRLGLTLILMMTLLTGDRPWLRTPQHLFWVSPGILLGVALLWSRLLLRPELVSFVFLVLIIRLVERPTRKNWNWRQLASLMNREGLAFLVTLLWAQCHGFAAMAPVIWLVGGLLAFVPGSILPRPTMVRLLAGTGLLAVALLLTPNGWQGFIYPLKAFGQFSASQFDLRGTISELTPLLQTPNSLNLTIMAFKVSLVWGLVVCVWNFRRLSFLRILLWGLWAVATIAAQRNIGFYALAFVLLHTGIVDNGLAGMSPKWHRIQFPAKAAFLPFIISLSAAGWFGFSLITDTLYVSEGVTRRTGTGPTVARYPFQATEILSRSPGTHVFANVDAAALSLDLGQARVFIDGRTEAYSPETWARYHQFRKGGPDALALLDEVGAQRVLLAFGSSAFKPFLKSVLASPDWKVQHAAPAGVLLGRSPNTTLRMNQDLLGNFATHQPTAKTPNLSNTRKADLWAARSALAELAGLPEEQESYLRQGLSLRPDHPLIHHNLGNIILKKGQPKTALTHFKKALESNPRLASSALNAGVCLMNLRDFAGAEEYFSRSLRLQPNNYQAWANHSLALQQLGRFDQARASLTEALRLNPSNPNLRRALQDLKNRK